MAEAIATALISYLIGPAAAGGLLLTVVEAAVLVGLSVGATALADSFLAPNTPGSLGRTSGDSGTPPSDRQFINKAATSPRIRSYGRVRIAGAQVFLGASEGSLYRILAQNDGEIDAVEEHLLDDVVVTIGEDGWVDSPEHLTNVVRIQYRLGETDPAHYTSLEAAFPIWTPSHLGRGIAHSLTQFKQVDQSVFFDTYPSGESTTYKQTLRGSRVWDPRDVSQSADDPETWAWSDNAALAILDYLRHETGMGLPAAWFTSEEEAWIAAANACDDAIPLAAGGSEPRYRLWGTYGYDERPADVLSRMLTSCNGRLWIGTNGGLVLNVGIWVEPTVTIGDDAIISYKIGSGNERPETANTVTAVYTEPAQGYVEADAEPWADEDQIAAFGVQQADAQLYMVPSHAQCRRLMKQALHRLAPPWKGTLTTNLAGLAALTERFVRVQIAELDLDITVEIDNIEFRIENDSVVTGLIISITGMDQDAFDWNAAAEEGTPSEVPPPVESDEIPSPANFDVVIDFPTGSSFPVGVATWSAFSVDGLRVQVEYRVSGSSDFVSLPLSTEGATSVHTSSLEEGVNYEFRARTVGVTTVSDFTEIVTRMA